MHLHHRSLFSQACNFPLDETQNEMRCPEGNNKEIDENRYKYRQVSLGESYPTHKHRKVQGIKC